MDMDIQKVYIFLQYFDKMKVQNSQNVVFPMKKQQKGANEKSKTPGVEIQEKSGGQKCYGPLVNPFRKNSNSGPS